MCELVEREAVADLCTCSLVLIYSLTIVWKEWVYRDHPGTLVQLPILCSPPSPTSAPTHGRPRPGAAQPRRLTPHRAGLRVGGAAREAAARAAAARVPAEPRQLELLRRKGDALGRARRLGGAGLPRGDHGGARGLRLRQRRSEPSALDLGILQRSWG